MANEPIELLKNYDAKKLSYPAAMQQKFDGVPLRFFNDSGKVTNLTRQREESTAVDHMYADIGLLTDDKGWIIGEVYDPALPFKDISGLVRRFAPAPNLVLMVFDADCSDSGGSWITRQREFRERLRRLNFEKYSSDPKGSCIQPIWNKIVYNTASAEFAYQEFCAANPSAEGVVYHSCDALFQPGTRRWHVQKRLQEPMIDLMVTGFEEAVDKHGEPMGMVGRVVVSYNGKSEGVGPGKLTHHERTALWCMHTMGKFTPRIAQIKHKKDDTYTGLRQGTFQCWRPDKDEPDA